jgi:hypothetical protein
MTEPQWWIAPPGSRCLTQPPPPKRKREFEVSDAAPPLSGNPGLSASIHAVSQVPLIGSPHCLNSEFAFYTHSEHYLNITTHFRILFRIFGAHSASSQLIRTSEAHFGNFGPISDLRSLFRKLRTSKTHIPTFRYLRTTHPDHKYDL